MLIPISFFLSMVNISLKTSLNIKLEIRISIKLHKLYLFIRQLYHY